MDLVLGIPNLDLARDDSYLTSAERLKPTQLGPRKVRLLAIAEG